MEKDLKQLLKEAFEAGSDYARAKIWDQKEYDFEDWYSDKFENKS